MFDYEKTINEMYDTSAPAQVTYDSIYFKLPIEYSEHREINDIIRNDIELLPTNNIYKHVIPDSILVNKWSKTLNSILNIISRLFRLIPCF